MYENQKNHSSGDEMVNTADYDDYWRTIYQTTPYYAHKRKWTDYGPAYRLGYTGHGEHVGRKFNDIEADLAAQWEIRRAASTLAWADARAAVRDGWQYLEAGYPVMASRGS